MPIWISHRGYCADNSENTAESFRAAIILGFDYLETDLRTTADGHIVLFHDRTLMRLGNQALVPELCKRKELERVQLIGGEKIVFFDEFLSEFSNNHWILDIKAESAVETTNRLLSFWQSSKYADFFKHRVRFLFWNKQHQQRLLDQRPNAVCMARLGECRRAGLACLTGLTPTAGVNPGKTYALPPRFRGINMMRSKYIQRYRAHGGRVLAYLPETDEDTRRALDAGTDEILTNGKILH